MGKQHWIFSTAGVTISSFYSLFVERSIKDLSLCVNFKYLLSYREVYYEIRCMTAYQSDRIEDLYSETFSVLYVKKDADRI